MLAYDFSILIYTMSFLASLRTNWLWGIFRFIITKPPSPPPRPLRHHHFNNSVIFLLGDIEFQFAVVLFLITQRTTTTVRTTKGTPPPLTHSLSQVEWDD